MGLRASNNQQPKTTDFPQFEAPMDASSKAALAEIEEERVAKQKEIVEQGRTLSIFLTFIITTLVVLFFAAMIVMVFQSVHSNLFSASPTIQILSIAAPILALLALSIVFNFKRITSPVLYRFQKILFYPVDFAFKVWQAEFQYEFNNREKGLIEAIETQEDQIEILEKKLDAQRNHGQNIEGLLKDRIQAQNYAEVAARSILEHTKEYVLFIDQNGIIPDYYSRSVLALTGKELRGELFSTIAEFDHQKTIEFNSFLSHSFERNINFYEIEKFAPKISEFNSDEKGMFQVQWRYRPHFSNKGQMLYIIAIGEKVETESSSLPKHSHKAWKSVKTSSTPAYQIEAQSLNQFSQLVQESGDMRLKKAWANDLLRQPLKALIGELEMESYQIAANQYKELEFDYFASMNESISIETFNRALPIFKRITNYLVSENLETPPQRVEAGKLGCGRLNFQVCLSEYGAKGTFFKLSVDGQGISVLGLKADLMKAGMLSRYQSLKDEDLITVLFNRELNQFYRDHIFDFKNKIAQPEDLSTIKQEIEQMKGSVSLRSEEGFLTEFELFIPESI